MPAELEGEHLLELFELVCGMDLYDSSRLESFHPALRALCMVLVASGFGDRETSPYDGMTVTTARKYLAYLDEVAAEIARERAGLQPPW